MGPTCGQEQPVAPKRRSPRGQAADFLFVFLLSSALQLAAGRTAESAHVNLLLIRKNCRFKINK
uniref:Uncharacterized protein n=1 Tax=Anguilla anguilla TaxID=7936 RepID=A0A0E9V2L1_ANGAN